jgi:hypothetical protein
VGQTTMSLSNYNIKKNANHHRMSITASTHPSEDRKKNYKHPIFAKILIISQTTHALVKKKKLELINLIS